VNATSLIGRVDVVADQDGLTSRAGTALLVGVADRVGLTGALGEAMQGVRERASRHCPGRALRDVAVMLADGGDALCDVRALRDEPALFGPVASDATAWRAIASVDADRLDAIRRARAVAREWVWAQTGAPRRVILDIDATLVTAHSEKEGAAGTYKGGYGFNPLVCFEAESGEAMSALLRPGNAGSNNAWDHIEVLCLALEQLPTGVDRRSVLLRCDSGGATHLLTDTASELEMRFTVGFDLAEPVRAAILRLPESAWQPALAADGEPRAGAGVAELADLDLSAWPAGTRAICRRERPHPGAQLSFTDHDGHRFQVFITNQTGGRIARLEQIHRQRASVEDAIRCAKDSGLRNLPFRAFQPNAAWLELVLTGQDLIAWTQRLLLAETPARRWEPKRLRYRILHVAARITRHARRTRLHLPSGWPWRHELITAWQRLSALPVM
jgi:Transposase DDE domain group 1